MELATEIVKLVTALLGLLAAVFALMSKARGRTAKGKKKKGRRR